jgi:hypothetical protein
LLLALISFFIELKSNFFFLIPLEPNDRNPNSSDENYSQAEPIDYSQSSLNNNSQVK